MTSYILCTVVNKLWNLVLKTVNRRIKEGEIMMNTTLKCLIIIHSYHHNNTAKVAEEISKVLNGDIVGTTEIIKESITAYDLIGFGAGIDSGRHYQPLLDFAEKLPILSNQKCFIFSTSGVQGVKKVKKDHDALRMKLLRKRLIVIDEFSCKGFNTNSFLKFFGGMNRGRPNENDLKHAKEFAFELLQKMDKF